VSENVTKNPGTMTVGGSEITLDYCSTRFY
jgi:hypothetical protein